jgi:DNA repair protein RadC
MTTIKEWAEEDQPREKFFKNGRGSLSDTELIAILIRSGSATENAIEVARTILQSVQYDLNLLAKKTIKDLTKIKGVGEVKAISILAALELGGRREATESRNKAIINSSASAYAILKNKVEDLAHEEFWIITLDRAHKFINEYKISEGGVSATVVDPKKIFKKALEDQASGLLLCHNHPSGNIQPSPQDIALTQKLKEGAQMLDILVLDHIIVGDKKYYSFADEGKL